MYVPMSVEAGGQPQAFLRLAIVLLRINSFCSLIFNFYFFKSGAGDVVQDLRALAALAEHPGLVLNKHKVQGFTTTCNSSPLWPLWAPAFRCTHSHTDADIYTHNLK